MNDTFSARHKIRHKLLVICALKNMVINSYLRVDMSLRNKFNFAAASFIFLNNTLLIAHDQIKICGSFEKLFQ